MFTIDQTVDTIQGAKKQFVKTFVTNQTVAEALNSFVDAQSEYTKKAAKVGMDTFNTLTKEATKSAQTAMKFDYAKFSETMNKAFNLSK